MMKRLFGLILLALPLVCSAQYRSAYRSAYESETVAALREHVGYLASAALEGRLAGSEGEKDAAVYFSEELEKLGVDVISGAEGEVFGIRQENGDTLTSRNVIGFIPGFDKELRERYIVIGARLDNLGSYDVNVNGEREHRIFFGANGNASGLAMLLELARKLSINSVLLKRSVIIAAFGSSVNSGAGAWYFLNRSFGDVPAIDAMINLDMLGTGSGGFYAYTASNADMDYILRSLDGTLQPVRPRIVTMEPCGSDHRIFYDREIPSVFFTTGMYPEYNSYRDTPSILEYDGMEKELEYLYNFSITLANGPKPLFRPSEAPERVSEGGSRVLAYYECDRRPSFLGNSDPNYFLREWVYRYLRYPDEAVRAGIQGRVLVSFIIDEKGKVTDVEVRRGVHPLLDAEALRVVRSSIDWKPGMVKGKAVKAAVSLYVEFRLQKN